MFVVSITSFKSSSVARRLLLCRLFTALTHSVSELSGSSVVLDRLVSPALKSMIMTKNQESKSLSFSGGVEEVGLGSSSYMVAFWCVSSLAHKDEIMAERCEDDLNAQTGLLLQ